MTTRDIRDQIKGLYDIEISEGLVSKISEKILPDITEWHTLRTLVEPPIGSFISIHFHGCDPLQDQRESSNRNEVIMSI